MYHKMKALDFLYFVVFIDLLCLSLIICQQSVNLKVDTNVVINTVDDRYAGVTIDARLIRVRWGTFNISSPRMRALAAGLKYSKLRIGGTSGDYLIFTPKNATGDEKATRRFTNFYMYASDWDKIMELLKVSKWPLFFEFNLRGFRKGKDWDPSNALKLLRYTVEKGYHLQHDLNFELGNEPRIFPAPDRVTGAQVGKDFNILYRTLRRPEFKGAFHSSQLAGPDMVSFDQKFLTSFINGTGSRVNHITMHHYSFYGPNAPVSRYYDVKTFDAFRPVVQKFLEGIKSSAYPDRPLWNGETGAASFAGTKDVSNRYVASFLWLDKLGVCAESGVKAVLRQTFFGGGYYCFVDNSTNPTPDYWMTYLYTRVVGRKVFKTHLSNDLDHRIRFYTHCSKFKSGVIISYGMNISPVDTVTIHPDSSLFGNKLNVYMMTPGDTKGLVSPYVSLNGLPLKLKNDTIFPEIVPIRVSTNNGVTLKPLTYVFIEGTKNVVKECI